MRILRRSLTISLVAALALSGASMTASADEQAAPEAANPGRPTMAAGLIVTTTNTKPSAALLRDAETGLPADVSVAKVRSKGNRKAILVTDQRIPAAQAEALAVELRKRSDVVSAAPNYISHAFGVSPVTPNDSLFGSLKHLWDARAKTDSRVKAVLGTSNSFPAGGYSSKAPSLWRSTEGAGQVVAVVDTGITDHPDLDNKVLPGYDLVSEYPLTDEDGNVVALEDTGRDGNGRDGDANDEGDWEEAEYCYEDSPQADSTWHGTHVAGIVAAQGGNSQGIVGVAPESRILPVRVLGLCGGTVEDITDGIRWAAGLPVAGTPVNSNPADVINLSFGGYFPCTMTDAPEYVGAIADARAAGSVVVAAAGNDGVSIETNPISPATCPGVISVGATSEYGDRAGYKKGTKKAVYSNGGTTLDISAAGGDTYWDNRGILSSLNTGATSPVGASYGQYVGTSMAAPVVSGGAALIRSLGEFAPDQTEAALKAAVSPFPSGTHSQFKKCTTSICGKGILDLAKVPAPLTAPTIGGAVVVGETLTATPGTWAPKPSALAYSWLRDGQPIANSSATTYTVSPDDVGTSLSVRTSPSTGVFAPIAATSSETTAVPQGPTVTLTGVPVSTTYGVGQTVTVTVASEEGPVDGPVELRRGNTVLVSGVAAGGSVDLEVAGTAWIAGANPLRAAFVGTESHPASSTPAQTVTVAKASSTNTLALPTSISKSKKAKLTVTIGVIGDPRPTGTLTVYDGSKKIASGSLVAGNNGIKTLTLPTLKKGNHKIKVVYAGNANISGSTSAVKTIASK